MHEEVVDRLRERMRAEPAERYLRRRDLFGAQSRVDWPDHAIAVGCRHFEAILLSLGLGAIFELFPDPLAVQPAGKPVSDILEAAVRDGPPFDGEAVFHAWVLGLPEGVHARLPKKTGNSNGFERWFTSEKRGARGGGRTSAATSPADWSSSPFPLLSSVRAMDRL